MTITPLFLAALDAAIQTMGSYDKNESLNKEANREDDCVVRDVCRMTLADNKSYRVMLMKFVEDAREAINQ
jgi:hypothetical protein